MSEKLLLGPSYLICDLWKEGSGTITLAHIDALLTQLELVDGMNALHWSKHGNLNVDVGEFGYIDLGESRVLKGSGFRHSIYRLIERRVLSEMTDATSQSAVLMQRYKGTTWGLEFFR